MALDELAEPMNFAALKTLLSTILNRGRDAVMPDEVTAGMFINGAEQHICTELGGDCKFLETEESITIEGGNHSYTFSPQVREVISLRDEANYMKLGYLDRQRFDAYVANLSGTSGSPTTWTRFGYVRRVNSESPDQPYGQLQIQVYPVAPDDHVLVADEILAPGSMVYDHDMPVVPIAWHTGLLYVAAWQAAGMDIGSQSFQKFERLASIWMKSMVKETHRNMAGSMRMIPREDYERLRPRGVTVPPTRRAQLLSG